MTLLQILSCFLLGHKRSSLRDWSREFPELDYALLTAFFRQHFNVQKLLWLAAGQLFNLSSGYFILDEIVIERSKLGTHADVKFRYKSAGGYVIPAFSIVLLLWTDGQVRIPIRFELRRPGEGSHVDAALRLLSWARNQWGQKPQCVLFDSGFCSERMLKRIDAYGWAFICRIPKTRKFEGKQLWRYKQQGYWNAVGHLACGVKVKAIRRKDKFFICNRLSWEADEIVAWYRKRHTIEETFRILKGHCHWKGCQLRSHERVERFLGLGALAFMVWELNRLAHREPPTIYELRRNAILRLFEPQMPDLDSLLLAS